MAIRERFKNIKPEINISGPAGNAFALMGAARDLGRQIGMEREDIDALISEMMEGDYEHLLEVFDREFGTVVDLVR
jgi:hypothetical protein